MASKRRSKKKIKKILNKVEKELIRDDINMVTYSYLYSAKRLLESNLKLIINL